MSEMLQESLDQARKGRSYWLWLMETYHLLEGKYVIVIPEANIPDAYLAMLFLEDLIREKDIKSVIILSVDSMMKEIASSFSDKVEDVVFITEETKNALLMFYCLYGFSSRFMVASLTQPKGRKGKGLLQTGKVCYAELFAVIVYGLSEVTRKEPPIPDSQEARDWIEQNSKMVWQVEEGEKDGD